MSSRIQFRRDTAATWTTDNPVLADGEPGVEHDTGRLKVGDGIRVWTALPYAALDTNTYLTVYQLTVSPVAPTQPVQGMVWIQSTS